MVRLKLRTCSTNGISMKTSRLAQAVTSHSLIIVREFALMQGLSEWIAFRMPGCQTICAFLAWFFPWCRLDPIGQFEQLVAKRHRDPNTGGVLNRWLSWIDTGE